MLNKLYTFYSNHVLRINANRIRKQNLLLEKHKYFLHYNNVFKSLKDIRIISELLKKKNELILGQFDRDGRFISDIIKLPNNNNIFRKINYINKQGSNIIELIILNDKLLIKKKYLNSKKFYNEWFALEYLFNNQINVPKVYSVNEKKLILYKEFLYGYTIRELLVNKGAKILINDIDQSSKYLLKEKSIEKVWIEGKKYIPTILDSQIISSIFLQIQKLHSLNFGRLSITYGNLIIQDNKVWFYDFENSICIPYLFNFFLTKYNKKDNEKFFKLYPKIYVE